VDSVSTKLGQVSTSKLSTIASQWQALDEYVAKKAYVGVFGYQTFPAFTSNRIDLGSAIFHPLYGWDWSSFAVK
jgi:peptide/nickel transport system substrate-binding protein